MSTNLNDLSFDQLVRSKSKYLSKDDVGDAGKVLTIKGFKSETIDSDEGEETKIVMYFVENVKPMVLNRTNSQLIGAATGAKTAGDARGKKIRVYNDPMITFGGKVTGGLRIKKADAAAATEANDAPFDDDVPF